MTQPSTSPPPLTHEQLEALQTLVEITLDEDRWEALRTAVQMARDRETDAETSRTKAKDALSKQAPGLNVDAVLSVASRYCDQLYVDLSSWKDADRERWVSICQTITETTSSTVT